MIPVTLSVIDGLKRGHIYDGLVSPIMIGREEDNDVQLNDERVSRVHAKIQEDRGQVILIDLNSTNGSCVNGHLVQLRVLRPGDHLQIGRCTLLFGSDKQITDRARELGVRVDALSPIRHVGQGVPGKAVFTDSRTLHAVSASSHNVTADNLHLPLFQGTCPPVPENLDPGQRARLSDMLSYIYVRLRDVAFDSQEPSEAAADPVTVVPWKNWQNVLLLQRDLAVWLNEVASPEGD